MVGAGIGGTAAAYYLREQFGPGVKIDVFEPGDVGGRLATVKIGDHEYETGGAVIHPLNLHMKHFMDRLGKRPMRSRYRTLRQRQRNFELQQLFFFLSIASGIPPRRDVPSKMAIFDGKELVFEESDWFIINFLRLLWRYGFSFLRMQMWVEGILDKFMR